jgi:hypothetical protein
MKFFAIVREAAVEAWQELWAIRLFRRMVYVDIAGLLLVALILGVCYFDGKIGLVK